MQKNFYKIDDNRWVEDDDSSSLNNIMDGGPTTVWAATISIGIFVFFAFFPDQFVDVVDWILSHLIDIATYLIG
jgi:hypothetical protein